MVGATEGSGLGKARLVLADLGGALGNPVDLGVFASGSAGLRLGVRHHLHTGRDAEIGQSLDRDVEGLFALLGEVEELGQRGLGQLGAYEAADLGLQAGLAGLGEVGAKLLGLGLQGDERSVALCDLTLERLDDEVHGLLVDGLGSAHFGSGHGGRLRSGRRLGGLGHGCVLLRGTCCIALRNQRATNARLGFVGRAILAGEGFGVAWDCNYGVFVKLVVFVDEDVATVDLFDRDLAGNEPHGHGAEHVLLNERPRLVSVDGAFGKGDADDGLFALDSEVALADHATRVVVPENDRIARVPL